MSYQVNILRRAQKTLGGLEQKFYERVRNAIRKLADEPKTYWLF